MTNMRCLIIYCILLSVHCLAAQVERVISLQPREGVQMLGEYKLLPDPTTGHVIVLATHTHNLGIFDPATGELRGPIPIPAPLPDEKNEAWVWYMGSTSGWGLWWGRGREVYAAHDNSLALVDPDRLQILANRTWDNLSVFDLARGPTSLAVGLGSSELYRIAILDPKTLQTRAQSEFLSWPSGNQPNRLAWSPARKAFVLLKTQIEGPPLGWRTLPPEALATPIDSRSAMPIGVVEDPEGGYSAAKVPEVPSDEIVVRLTGDELTRRLEWSNWRTPGQPLGSVVIAQRKDKSVMPDDWPWPPRENYVVPVSALDPQRRYAAVILGMYDGMRGYLYLLDLKEARLLGVTQVAQNMDWDEGSPVTLAADWPRQRLIVGNDGRLLVLSAKDASLIAECPSGLSVSSATFYPSHGILAVTGWRAANFAWVIGPDLQVKTLGPRPGRGWAGLDPTRGLAYVNKYGGQGWSGYFVSDMMTGEHRDYVEESNHEGVLETTSTARHPQYIAGAADLGRHVWWTLPQPFDTLVARDINGDLVQKLPLDPRPLFPDRVWPSYAVDPIRRTALIYFSPRSWDPDFGGTDSERREIYRASLETGRVERLLDLPHPVSNSVLCPWSGEAATVVLADGQRWLVIEGDLTLLPSPEKLAKVPHDHEEWGESLTLDADFEHSRILVQDSICGVVMVVTKSPPPAQG